MKSNLNMVDKIKHIFLVLMLPTKSVFKDKNIMPYTTYIDWHGVHLLVGPRATAHCAHT
jgi:hypothetical protein